MDVTKPPSYVKKQAQAELLMSLSKMERIFERVLAGEVFLSQLQRGFDRTDCKYRRS